MMRVKVQIYLSRIDIQIPLANSSPSHTSRVIHVSHSQNISAAKHIAPYSYGPGATDHFGVVIGSNDTVQS